MANPPDLTHGQPRRRRGRQRRGEEQQGQKADIAIASLSFPHSIAPKPGFLSPMLSPLEGEKKSCQQETSLSHHHNARKAIGPKVSRLSKAASSTQQLQCGALNFFNPTLKRRGAFFVCVGSAVWFACWQWRK